MSIYRFLYFLSVLALLAGCDQQAMFEKFTPKEEADTARRLLSQLAVKNYDPVEKQLDHSIQTPSLRGSLEQMAATFPSGEPTGVAIVGSNTVTANGVTTYNLTFEYEYPNAWLLTNVVLKKSDGQTTVLGLHVTPMKQSLQKLNRFTFEGKGAFHYLVFALVVSIPLFIVFSLVLCARTALGKRKWLWLLFVALGFVQFSFNWTDGSYAIQPISFALLGAAFFRAGPYAPFIFTVALPVGAIVFLVRRRSLATRNERLGAGAPSS